MLVQTPPYTYNLIWADGILPSALSVLIGRKEDKNPQFKVSVRTDELTRETLNDFALPTPVWTLPGSKSTWLLLPPLTHFPGVA